MDVPPAVVVMTKHELDACVPISPLGMVAVTSMVAEPTPTNVAPTNTLPLMFMIDDGDPGIRW